MFNFTPTEDMEYGIKVPYIEDARADFAPYYSSRGTIQEAQSEIIGAIIKMGGSGVIFREGFFGAAPKRYGYVVEFQLGGAKARMQVAGLPMKHKETKAKKTQVLLQALLNLRDWLKAAVTAQVFSPGNNALIQFLLVDGNRTIGEMLVQDRRLPNMNPALPAPEIVVSK
jgi:hypothetical protein